MVRAYLMCPTCKNSYDFENYPVQSAACGHSVCKLCVLSEGQKAKRSDANNNNQDVTAITDEESLPFACPICHEGKAFHLTKSNPNILGCAAIKLLQDLEREKEANKQEQLRQEGTAGSSRGRGGSKSASASNHDQHQQSSQVIIPASVPTASTANNHENITSVQRRKGNGRPLPEAVRVVEVEGTACSPAGLDHPSVVVAATGSAQSSPSETAMNTTTSSTFRTPNTLSASSTTPSQNESDRSSSTTTTTTTKIKKIRNRKTCNKNSVSPSPERMVWVKFGKCSQLAYLLSTNGDTANIRWESGKYEEEVSLDVIEELDAGDSSGGCSGGSKRSRRYHNQLLPKNARKSQKRRKALL